MKLFVVVVAVVLSVFVLGRAGGQSALEFGVKLFVVVVAVVLSVFVLGRAGGQSALEFGVKLFAVVVVVCFCFGAGGGPVRFGVWCETVRRRRRRRRRLFLFWGGRGASQLWSLV